MSPGPQNGYRLQGTLLEACSCPMPCACWVGEDPPSGYCYALNAYHLASGQIGGTDVSSLNVVRVTAIPGNVRTPGSWREVLIVDDKASDSQHDALVAAFTGTCGGPLADIARLVGEVLGVERMAIKHDVAAGKGTVSVGGAVEAEVRPLGGKGGRVRRSVFGRDERAHLATSVVHRVRLPNYGMEWEYEATSAVQRDYEAQHAG